MAATLIIAATPRTGSSLLSALLRSTGVLGLPQEYALAAEEYHWGAANGCASHQDYVTELRKLHATANGTSSIKLMWWQLSALGSDLGSYGISNKPRIVDRLTASLGDVRFVFLKRKCIVSQAISYVRAHQSGQWALMHNTPVATSMSIYDPPAIDAAVDRLRLSYSNWGRFFRSANVQPLALNYEALVESPQKTISTIAELAGVSASLVDAVDEAPFRKQADQTSEEWYRRYVSEKAAETDLGPQPTIP